MLQRPSGKMRAWSRIVALLLCGLFAGSAATTIPDAGMPATGEPIAYRQIDLRERVASHFADVSSASLAMVAVPDPRVPRHRRAYDLSIVALIQGMLDEGYVLDRYNFPWEEILRQTDSGKQGTTQQTDDGQYGLMIFRRDTWREEEPGPESAPELRALYLVPETNTYGLPRGTMIAAMCEMWAQTTEQPTTLPEPCKPDAASGPAPQDAAPKPGRTHLASHGNCTARPSYFLLLGPNFSGSLDSLAQIAYTASGSGLPPICAVSASATATSNARVHRFQQPHRGALEFHSLAVGDDRKLAELWAMAERLGADRPGKIAILNESTVFGNEVCRLESAANRMDRHEYARTRLCRNAVAVSFPANIADVRAGLRARKAEPSSELRRLMPQQHGLPLEDGAGNGSELPYNLQSKLTAAGNELELRKAIRMLAQLRPRMVIVVATDIRDRLFLLDMLREGVPYAQLVDLELDQLMAHPEYIHATRGALLVGSERTTASYTARADGKDKDHQARSMWKQANSYTFSSTDYQVLLRRITSGINDDKLSTRSRCPDSADHTLSVPGARDPILHVVGRERIVALDCLSRSAQVTTSWITPLLGLLAILLLAACTPAVQALLGHPTYRDRDSPPHHTNRWYRHWVGALLTRIRRHLPVEDPSYNHTLPTLLAGFLSLLVSSYLGGGKSTLVITMLAAPPLCWALAYQTAMHRRNSLKPYRMHWNELLGRRIARHLLVTLALALLVSLSGWWLLQEFKSDPVTITTIARFAYRADQGLAIGTAMTMSILGLVFADNALAVARNASERNHFVALSGFWQRSDQGRINCHLLPMFNVSLFPRSAVMVLGVLALCVCFTMALPLKVGLFGEFLSWLALVAVTSLDLLALAFLANAVNLRRRALYLAGVVQSYARMGATGPVKGDDCALGLWNASDAAHVRFASTPASVRLKDAGGYALRLLGPVSWPRFAADLGRLRVEPRPVDGRTRAALYVLFASEISQMRWATFSSAAFCLSVAAFVYLYPVSGANGFVLFAVGLLMVNGLFAGFTAMSFEKNETMSNILCNRTSKVEFSGTLFNYIALPFVILAACLAIVQVPGVLDWSEGLFQSALNVARGRTLESVF